MKLLVSSFYTLTEDVVGLIKKWESKEEDYMLVMTDSTSPFITDARRQDFLTDTLLYKEFPIEFTAYNESSGVDFVKVINNIVKELEGTEVYYQTNFEEEDFGEDLTSQFDFEYTELGAPKGDIQKNVDNYVSESDATWRERCGRIFTDIVKQNISKRYHDTYFFVPYFDLDDKGTSGLLRGRDLISKEFTLLDSYTSEAEHLQFFLEALSESLGTSVIDWDIRSMSDRGTSSSVIFAKIEYTEGIKDIVNSNRITDIEPNIALVYQSKGVIAPTTPIDAWLEAMIDDITEYKIKEAEFNE